MFGLQVERNGHQRPVLNQAFCFDVVAQGSFSVRTTRRFFFFLCVASDVVVLSPESGHDAERCDVLLCVPWREVRHVLVTVKMRNNNNVVVALV